MTILEQAQQLVHGDRNDVYGHPLQDFQRVAVLWSGILNLIVTPEQVGLCLVALKLAREVYGHKRDTLVDIAGYAECLQMIADYKESQACPTSPSAPPAATSSSPSEATSAAPSVTPSPSPVAKDDAGTCPKCQMFLPHASLGQTHTCVSPAGS